MRGESMGGKKGKVHNHNEKIYACFADFKKAFDSIWHVGLLYKLLQINVGG